MCIECYFAKMFYKDNFTLYAFSLVLFMFFNIIGAGLCTSLVNLLLCLSAVLGGSERWLMSGSDIPIEQHSSFPVWQSPVPLLERVWMERKCLSSLWCPAGWAKQAPGQKAATQSHHEFLLRQPAALRASWLRFQRKAAVVGSSADVRQWFVAIQYCPY